MAKVSIIMPTYNCEKYIKETIDSVLNQSTKDWELIIVDDFSNDKTVDIIKKINNPRIKLIINESNKGAAYSRNTALTHASGEYIAFLDGDDLWTPNKLEEQIKFMENNNYQFSYTNYEEIDDDENKLGILVTGPKKVTRHKFNCMDYVGCLTVMYKREIYPDLQIPNNLPKNNDYAMWLLLSKRADCYLLDKSLAMYRRHTSGSISSGKKSSLFKYHMDLFQKVYSFGKFRSFLYALRNVVFYFYKKIRYTSKTK